MLLLLKSQVEMGNEMPSPEDHPPAHMVGHPHPQNLLKMKAPRSPRLSGQPPKKVKNPGARGSTKWYRNDRGEVVYGTPPRGALPAAAPHHAHHWPGGKMHPLPLPASVSTEAHTDGRYHHQEAAIAALHVNQKLNPIQMPTTPEEHRADVLHRLGLDPNNKRNHKRKLPAAPTTAIRWAQDPSQVAQMFNELAPEVREAALHGLEHVEDNMKLARNRAITPRSVLNHFAWAMLSRSAEPYTQESAYIDLEHSGLNRFIDKAINGTFDLDEYNAWVDDPQNPVLALDAVRKGYKIQPQGLDPKKADTLSQDSPGKAVMPSVRAIGTMLRDWNGNTKPLTDMFNDPNISGQEARRQFWAKGYGGSGINNKILSFTIGMLGKPDVMVMDIWQARKFHPEAYAQALADGASKKLAEMSPEDQEKISAKEEQLRNNLAAAADAHEAEGTKDTAQALEEARHLHAKHVEKYNKGNLGEATTKLVDPYGRPGGPVGLAAYESLENLLEKAKDGLPTESNGLIGGKITPSVFALHWLAWVSNFDSAVKHSSLDTPVRLDQQGLSSRAQAATTADAPSATDALSQQAYTSVEQGSKKTANFGTIYQRGDVDPTNLEQRAHIAPAEFAPGKRGPQDQFGQWLHAQPPDVRSQYTEAASKHLEPVMRQLAKEHGLALSVDENFGGYDGSGNSVSQAILVGIPRQNPDGTTSKMGPREQEQAVGNYAKHLAWALKQDMGVYGRVAESWDEPGIKPAFDFQLTRRLTPEENDRLATVLHQHAQAGGGVGSGFSLLNNNALRAINFQGVDDDTYRNQMVKAIERVDPSLLSVGNDNNYLVRKLPYKSEAFDNDWNSAEPPSPTGPAPEGDNGSGVHSRGTTGNGTGRLAHQLRQALDTFNASWLDRAGQQQAVAKSFLYLGKKLFRRLTKSAGGPQWRTEKRDRTGRWTANYGGLAPTAAEHLERAIHHAHHTYADMSGLAIGPSEEVAKSGDQAPDTHMLTTFATKDHARAIGFNPKHTGDSAKIAETLRDLREKGHLAIPDEAGLAHHEAGHVVMRRNPAGKQVQRAIVQDLHHMVKSGQLREEELEKAVGRYGLRNASELFAELYRLHNTSGLPGKLAQLAPHFDSLAKAHRGEFAVDPRAEEVHFPSTHMGQTFVHRAEAGLTDEPSVNIQARDRQRQAARATIMRERAAQINPLLGEFSRFPMTPETEWLRYSKSKPEVQARFDELNKAFQARLDALG